MAALRRLSSASIPAGAALTTRRLSSSQLSDTAARRLSVESLSLSPTIPYERRPSGGPLTPRPTLTPTNTPASLNALLAPPSMSRRASTYHDTDKANSGELDNSGGFVSGADIIRRERGVFPRAPSTPRRSVATPSSLYPLLLDGVLRAGRRGRIGRSGESSSRRSPACCRAPTPPWWTRSRDAGLAAEVCCCSFDSFPFPPPCLSFFNTLPT